ncbi:MAG TPA: ammonium transporter [Tepidisphaeraceae bacterium]
MIPSSPFRQRRPSSWSWLQNLAVAALFVVPTLALAQDAGNDTAPAAAAAAPTKPAIDTGSTAWMLMSAALVLLMMPGLALFYGGMVRAKNVLNTFLNVMVCCGVMGVIWVVIGYALVFPVIDNADGTNKALISLGSNAYPDPADSTKEVQATVSILGFDPNLIGLGAFGEANNDDPGASAFNAILTSGDTVGAVPTGVPELIFAMFQGMFFIITPALIVGAVAERVRLGPLLVFLVIWSLVVYAPMAHMVWNVNGYLFQKGVLDFAGGTVVHVLAGVSALALTLVVGPRKGFGRVSMPPHSLGYTLIGAGLLWFGWFGFNAGSAIGIGAAWQPVAGGVAVLAFANTQICAAAAALAWMLVEWIKDGKPTILGFASGMVAGLVVITPCAGHVAPMSAIILGLLGGVVCYFGCQLKKVFKYDDTLDAFGVHGIGGALGAVLVGVFAIRPMGGTDQVMKQLLGLGIAVVFAFVVSLVLALAIKAVIGLRAKEEDEEEGLDVALHGETGYNLSNVL